VTWEENIRGAEDRINKRYEEPIDACSKGGWTPDYYHLAVGYVSCNLLNLMRGRFAFTTQQAAEKASYFMWLQRDNKAWIEYRREQVPDIIKHLIPQSAPASLKPPEGGAPPRRMQLRSRGRNWLPWFLLMSSMGSQVPQKELLVGKH